MKVVLFCGGLGMRLREYSESIPKPMVEIGYRPILWYVMKYYAHYGHRDFILCLGYRADVIKNYFLNYSECLSNNFVLAKGAKECQLLSTDIDDWTITFVDTGLTSNIGQRLKAVEKYLEGEEIFLANYADGLTDLPLDAYLEHFQSSDKLASFVSVRPTQSFHVVSFVHDSEVAGIQHFKQAGLWINGGCFAFKNEVFKYIHDGEELVVEPFQRLIAAGQLTTFKYDGFWLAMDTFKDKQLLDDMHARAEVPWEVWTSTTGK
jgi:glucose-1-phosphate cytidylyltransferase